MSDSGSDRSPWLRPAPVTGPAPGERGDGSVRGGCLVRVDLKLGQLVRGRPPGVTTHQWNTALRTRFDFVVCDAATELPVFAVELAEAAGSAPEQERAARMTGTVCAALGLPLLRMESATLRSAGYGRRLVEYVIDARAFAAAVGVQGTPEQTTGAGGPEAGQVSWDEPVTYRDIIGRLPDGRTGFVNDLGALARVAAVEAYANRQLSDPIIRGLRACWQDGTAEGWGWVEVRDGCCLFERVRLRSQAMSCGVDPGRLAEDLAAVAVGERLRAFPETEPVLRHREELGRDLRELRARRHEMVDGFPFDHVVF